MQDLPTLHYSADRKVATVQFRDVFSNAPQTNLSEPAALLRQEPPFPDHGDYLSFLLGMWHGTEHLVGKPTWDEFLTETKHLPTWVWNEFGNTCLRHNRCA